MVIRKKPVSAEQEAKINAVIQKGGSPINTIQQSDEPYRLTLRIPLPLKVQVDDLIAIDPAPPSLTAWILEAIKQKLQRHRHNKID